MKKESGLNSIITRALRASLGLVIYGFGVYMMVQANIGLAPWDVFAMGFTNYVPITLGQSTILIGAIILVIDLLLHEKIGIGTILDVALVGTAMDVFGYIDIIPYNEDGNLVYGLILMTIGFFVVAFSQYVYMASALSCGPRDSFLVAIGKRLHKLPIGLVSIIIEVVVCGVGFLMDGPVGVGTLYSVVALGIALQIVFRIVKFEPRDVVHENVIESIKKAMSS